MSTNPEPERTTVSSPRPKLQIALDLTDLPTALAPLNKAIDEIDVIECGTVLLLCEGLRAVREIRALYPTKPILADIRIAEAGQLLSKLAFEAGASLVSVVAGASLTTIKQVCEVAKTHNGEVQVELADDWYDAQRAKQWRTLGVEHVIVKRSRDRESSGDLSWKDSDLERITELHNMGFTVTITGGIKANELTNFANSPVGIVIAGRALTAADDPKAAAQQFQQIFKKVWAS